MLGMNRLVLTRHSGQRFLRKRIHSGFHWRTATQTALRCALTTSRFFSSELPPKDNKKKEPDDTQNVLNNWLKQLKSPPNIITSLRILSTPVLSYLVISGEYEKALVGCLVAGFSDILDGYLAKNYQMETVMGTYLDPLADKLLINVLSLSLWYVDILPTPLIVIWLGRDVGLVVATYIHVSLKTKTGSFVVDPVTTPLKVEPTIISKVNTAFQFLTLFTGMIHPIYNMPMALETLCWITGGTTIASGWGYWGGASLTSSGNQAILKSKAMKKSNKKR